MNARRILLLAAGLGLIGVLGAVGPSIARRYEAELSAPFEARPADWAGSETCRTCHPDHHASWARTFHRTMTQEAGPDSVQGAFDGREVVFDGVAARPVRRDGRWFIDYLDRPGGEAVKSLPILRTVGSRRYQQYLTQDPGNSGDNWWRVPLLWHIGERRWLHLNAAFLGPDGDPYDQHLTLWNQNCIFCHNTGPEPGALNLDELAERKRRGEAVDVESDPRYASTVAELGVACESCHGPGAEHARRNRDPVRRYALHLGGRADPTIVNPARLAPDRAAQVCGQCHGARIPRREEDITAWLATGTPYRAGQDLLASVRPIFRDTPPPGGAPDDGFFALRFWRDGTARLTAYEYQGLLQSPCHGSGGLHCGSCHTMHGGDVRGQIEPAMRTNAACASCHPAIAGDVESHSRHRAGGPGSSCHACHMPEIVYGILEIHRSHRIEVPDPARDAAAGRPDACTACHLDRDPEWIAGRMRAWWGEEHRMPDGRGDGAPADVASWVAALHAGDPVQRAIAAFQAGAGGPAVTLPDRRWLLPHLALALEDRWPTVRWFARRSLRAILADADLPDVRAALRDYDHIGPAPERVRRAGDVLRAAGAGIAGLGITIPEGALLDAAGRPDAARVAALRSLQGTKSIRIGE